MSWSSRYKSEFIYRDSVDTVDTEAGEPASPRYSVNSVNSVPIGNCAVRAEGAGGEAAYFEVERAAIIGEGGRPEVQTEPPEWVRDILDAEKPRPLFTPGQAAEPAPGARCGCCKARSFWNDASEPKGWRCSICHPPEGAAPGAVAMVRT